MMAREATLAFLLFLARPSSILVLSNCWVSWLELRSNSCVCVLQRLKGICYQEVKLRYLFHSMELLLRSTLIWLVAAVRLLMGAVWLQKIM